MFTVAFVKALLERSLKTAAQTFAVLLGAGQADVTHLPWSTDLGLAGGAALVSVLTSIASGAITNGSPSVTNAEVLAVTP